MVKMLFHLDILVGVLAVASLGSAYPNEHVQDKPFDAIRNKRQATSTSNNTSGLVVDLGYETYQGFYNSSANLNTWLGVRYAAPPTGTLRFQAPQAPTTNRSQVIQANAQPSHCPQGGDAPLLPTYGFFATGTQPSEDCLFLNVFSPPNATDLPVFVWIHGGGYGGGSASQYDPIPLLNTNNNGFVAVIIQYRLAAFGFLSSDEVYRFGAPNAGLLDQHFALEWVQSHISQFGGNASQVTIAGESAGAGSVMLQDIAYGGSEGSSLFVNTISASPYLPMQYGYADFVPSQAYYAFAQAVGCFNDLPYGNMTGTIFDCIVSKDTVTLQNASAVICASGTYGTWAFLPVTDGTFLQDIPSRALAQKKVNGIRHLAGNNANEGPSFVNQTITTQTGFENFLNYTFPLFKQDDMEKLQMYYPESDLMPGAIDFATLGFTGPTALNESTFATGQQQRADNIYAETTFVCPSYWLAEAYTGNGRTAYKYQFSVVPAEHGDDISVFFPTSGLAPLGPEYSSDFVTAALSIWGNFVMYNSPIISAATANGANSSSTNSGDAVAAWPQWTSMNPIMLNLNETGGSVVSIPLTTSQNITVDVDPGLTNDFSLVQAYPWEGGRGYRCDYWQSVGGIVPE